MLADAEVHVAAARRVGFEIAGAFKQEPGLGRRREVGGAADQPRVMRRDGVEHLARRIARGDAFGVGGENRKLRVPVRRQLALLHPRYLVGQIGKASPVGFKPRAPGVVQAFAAPADAFVEMLANAVRHQKFGVFGPTVASLGETHFFFAERLAVGRAGVVLVGRAIADMTLDDDEGRRLLVPPENLDRLAKPLQIVDVADAVHVPAIGEEARRDIVAESEIGVAFDRDAVAVVKPAKISEHLMAGERGRFARHAFHHVAVAAHDINVVVEDREIGPVEMLRQPACGQRHADAVAAALAERTGRRLDAGGQVIFRVAGTFAADLPEALDVVERDRRLAQALIFRIDCFDAAEMQHRVKQHRCVSV